MHHGPGDHWLWLEIEANIGPALAASIFQPKRFTPFIIRVR
jgi:hypothetical protein